MPGSAALPGSLTLWAWGQQDVLRGQQDVLRGQVLLLWAEWAALPWRCVMDLWRPHRADVSAERGGAGRCLREAAVATMGPPGCLAHIAMCCAL